MTSHCVGIKHVKKKVRNWATMMIMIMNIVLTITHSRGHGLGLRYLTTQVINCQRLATTM